ncbi:MAG: universal stress protein UspE [Moritella sp.]|uniref:universal stress protein UspE n=1 Tax=unclassified Moritella TaxID=2637987 RepID=UPI0001569C9C|nr:MULTISPECIES: universal stress protein UspE [unclassified Moritella]EDM65115.1 Putative universal stress protein family [Moritella sp. PE36]MBL1416952.1 universal stress protein UspE [Moritella sp.]PHR89279.1 MAG: universal stress protein UspE [Moritella sp.]
MNKYKNILVVADPVNTPQIALSRALYLASQQDNVSISLLLVIYDLSYELTSLFSSDERQSMQDAIVFEEKKSFTRQLEQDYPGINIKLKLIWHKRPFESILEEAKLNNHDLIVKSTHAHNKLSAVVFTPTDWHLLRKSLCPVLLVKDHEWPIDGNIVAAIQVLESTSLSSEDDYSINERITQEAMQLKELLNANIHLVNAYPSTPEHISIEIPNFDAVAYNQEIEDHHKTAMYKHAEKFNVAKENVHIQSGAPEDVIADIVQEVDAELVILGAPTRNGFSAFLIGNTAEMVIDSINCDLLALK